ncbi:hypothetical protein Bbelb_068780 [Branchiostoma belcheri]|nr:hypothetical protein Bbelb_068780 [Branchiostoma belcheri]
MSEAPTHVIDGNLIPSRPRLINPETRRGGRGAGGRRDAGSRRVYTGCLSDDLPFGIGDGRLRDSYLSHVQRTPRWLWSNYYSTLLTYYPSLSVRARSVIKESVAPPAFVEGWLQCHDVDGLSSNSHEVTCPVSRNDTVRRPVQRERTAIRHAGRTPATAGPLLAASVDIWSAGTDLLKR